MTARPSLGRHSEFLQNIGIECALGREQPVSARANPLNAKVSAGINQCPLLRSDIRGINDQIHGSPTVQHPVAGTIHNRSGNLSTSGLTTIFSMEPPAPRVRSSIPFVTGVSSN